MLKQYLHSIMTIRVRCWVASAIGLGTFDADLKVLDGAVFSMNPDQVPKGLDPTPPQLRGLDVMLAAQVCLPHIHPL